MPEHAQEGGLAFGEDGRWRLACLARGDEPREDALTRFARWLSRLESWMERVGVDHACGRQVTQVRHRVPDALMRSPRRKEREQ